MRVIKEDLDNLDKVKDSQPVQNLVTADAQQTSEKQEKEANKVTAPQEKPFLGAEKQSVPEEPKLPKAELSESLFEEVSSADELEDVKYAIEDDCIRKLANWFRGLSLIHISGYEPDWADMSRNSPSLEKVMAKIQELSEAVAEYATWFARDSFEECLNESPVLDGRQISTLPPGGSKYDIKAEEEDIWTQVANELDNTIDPQDTKRKIKATKKERYTDVFPDMDGNILVYAPSEERMDFAKRVAKLYGLEIKVKPSNSRNSRTAWQATIYIPQERVYGEGVEQDVDELLLSEALSTAENEDAK